MSLFGTSPPSTAATSNLKSSLFDDVASPSRQKPASSGLFANQPETGASDQSPWDFQPTPRKQGRSALVRGLLPVSDVPDSYVDAFDALTDGADRISTPAGVAVAWAGLRRLMGAAGLAEHDADSILTIVSPDGQKEGGGLIRSEFNVLLALVGLAQEGEELSLDGVDERRRRLPRPKLPDLSPPRPRTPPRSSEQPDNITKPSAQPTPPNPQTPPRAPPQNIPPSSNSKQSQSLTFAEQDPWASPNTSRNIGHSDTSHSNTAPRAAGNVNGMSSSMPQRTTSSFTTTEDLSSSTIGASESTYGSSGANEWGDSSYGAGGLDPGFGGSGNEGSSGGAGPTRTPGPLGGRSSNNGFDEVVTITSIAEKEGMFLFQYRNYEVSSSKRSSKVIRRYSDFVWLLDCLHKKYPFRQLPLLPPKGVAINGRHIAADNSFIEKRRRGLARFANTLVRHPVLSQEQLVVMFFTVPTELSVWRKQASIQIQEEFTGRPLPPELEDSLPRDLEDLFSTTRTGVRRSAEIYIALCSLFERLVKRREGIAADYLRFSNTFASVSEASNETYAADNNDVPLLNEGIHATTKGVISSAALLGDESTAWDEGVLEDFKRQRDVLVSMRDLFDRRDRLDRDNIPALEKRIQGNEGKLSAVRAKPEGAKKDKEAEKLEESIMKDKASIIAQHARSIFVKECIRDEIHTFQSSLFQVSRLCQDWAAERVKYAELQADCWRALVEGIETMPVGE